MRWSIKLARIAGIDVHLHVTFAILLLWVGLSELVRAGNVASAALSVLFVVAIFGTIVLHELGHALTARRFGIRTRDITLYPIGGMARLERMPERPRHELLVAVAGPAVNFVIAGVLFAGLLLAGALRPPSLTTLTGSFVNSLAWANLFIAVFNLIPAFPMDGGRALRALLAMRTDYVSATHTAARVGKGLALVFGVVGLLYNPILVFIAIFVWIAASGEALATEMKASLEGIPVASAMITQLTVLSPDDPVGRIAQLALAGFQYDFPVVQSGAVVGVLTRARLLDAVASGRGGVPVSEVMDTDFVTAEPSELLSDVLTRLGSCACRAVPVLWHERLVGVLAMDQIIELMWLRRRGAGQRAGATAVAPWWRDRPA